MLTGSKQKSLDVHVAGMESDTVFHESEGYGQSQGSKTRAEGVEGWGHLQRRVTEDSDTRQEPRSSAGGETDCTAMQRGCNG